MKYDIVIAGVGGQGGLSGAVVIAEAASAAGFEVRQSEVHGMSQRGGVLVAHLRMADGPVAGPLVPRGLADLILATEPLEALRQIQWLDGEKGIVVCSRNPVRNMPDYPDEDALFGTLSSYPRTILVDSEALAAAAGAPKRGANMALLGRASLVMPLAPETLEAAIGKVFGLKGPEAVASNLEAFRRGRLA